MIAELVYYDASLIIKLIITPNRVLLEEVLEKVVKDIQQL